MQPTDARATALRYERIFPSIMAHWNHILFGDLIMLQRLVDNQIVVVDPAVLGTLPNAKSVSDTFADSLEELRVLRELVDSITWILLESLTLRAVLRWFGTQRRKGRRLRERSMNSVCIYSTIKPITEVSSPVC